MNVSATAHFRPLCLHGVWLSSRLYDGSVSGLVVKNKTGKVNIIITGLSLRLAFRLKPKHNVDMCI